MLVAESPERGSVSHGEDYDPLDPATTPSTPPDTLRRRIGFSDHRPLYCRAAYWWCFILGSGILFPWNSWIMSYEYFELMFGYSKTNGGWKYTEYWFSLCFYVPSVVLILALLRCAGRYSFRNRITVGFLLNVLTMLVPPILVATGSFTCEKVDGEGYCTTMRESRVATWTVMLATIGFSGVATGLLYGSIFGFLGNLPPVYTQACMAGNGASGVAVATMWIVVKITTGHSRKTGPDNKLATIYFLLSAAVCAACVGVFALLRRDRQIIIYLDGNKDYLRAKSVRESFARAPGKLTEHLLSLPNAAGQTSSWDVRDLQQNPMSGSKRGWDQSRANAAHSSLTIISVFGNIKYYALAVGWNFFTTLLVFPSLATARGHYQSQMAPMNFQMLLCASFMLFDFFGRQLPGKWVLVRTGKSLCVLVALRTLLVPLFGLMAAGKLPHIFQDYVVFGVMSAFALSNGYCGTLALMLAPQAVSKEHNARVRVATLMTCYLNLGVVAGCLLSFGWPTVLNYYYTVEAHLVVPNVTIHTLPPTGGR